MTLRPLNNYVVIEIPVTSNETASGLIIIKEKREQTRVGIVRAAFQDSLRIGARVVFRAFAREEIEDDDGKIYLLVPLDHVLGVLTEDVEINTEDKGEKGKSSGIRYLDVMETKTGKQLKSPIDHAHRLQKKGTHRIMG